MRSVKNRDKLFRSLGIGRYVWQKQIHGTHIHEVVETDIGTEISGSDGLFFLPHTDREPIFLTVHVGDCAPVLFFDPKTKAYAVAHAGWKGTSKHMTGKMIRMFIDHGSVASDILVSIGPCIGVCCYEVDKARASVFSDAFPGSRTVVNKSGNSWYIDIEQANIDDCRSMGVRDDHIEHVSRCTHCHRDEFFSFRRKDESFGEMIGFVGIQGQI